MPEIRTEGQTVEDVHTRPKSVIRYTRRINNNNSELTMGLYRLEGNVDGNYFNFRIDTGINQEYRCTLDITENSNWISRSIINIMIIHPIVEITDEFVNNMTKKLYKAIKYLI